MQATTDVGDARDASLRIREQVERGRRLDRAFAEAAPSLAPRERAFTHELTYGTTRLRARLDHLLAAHVHKGLHSLEPTVLELLRLGAYQILYMGSVPDYAAVSESVTRATRASGQGAGGLVNAVLRRVAEAGDGLDRFPSWPDDAVGFLTTWGSHPRWLIERWLARWDPVEVRALVEADNQQPRTCLALLDLEVGAARETLESAGIGCEVVELVEGCLRLHETGSVEQALAALPRSIVQDPAAQLVVHYAAVAPGTKVADLCAAPGGKAITLSTDAAYTIAADRSESRMHMVRDNVHRTSSRVALVVADACVPPVVALDAILLDVPCTGTGTLARHPDARWRLKEGQVGELAAVQERLLMGAADAVAPGGLLVYSTCTLEPEENERQVESFLASRADFRLEDARAVDAAFVDECGRLSVLPQRTGFDGAFAARLRRAA